MAQSRSMEPWVGFLLTTLLQVLGFGAVLFIARQGKGENKQQMQGETIASLRSDIRGFGLQIDGIKEASERRVKDVEDRLERHLTMVDGRLDQKRQKIEDISTGLSRLESIVENLAKTVDRFVTRDDRERDRAADTMPDVSMLRAIMFLMKNGGALGGEASGG